eukprot:7386699-Prymnesium_polylepis.1
MKVVGNTRTFSYAEGSPRSCFKPGVSVPAYGATAWDVTAANGMDVLRYSSQAGSGGSAGTGISGQLVELAPGGSRPPVWTLNADGILFVIE